MTPLPAQPHAQPRPRQSIQVQLLETLVVERFGSSLGKHSERLRVSQKDEPTRDVPLLGLRQVIVKGRGVSISTDALLACAERGIAIHVIGSRSGANGINAGASFYPDGLTGTVQTRRAQLLAYDQPRSVLFAVASARAKLANQAGVLGYHARSRKDSAPAAHMDLRVILHEVRDHMAELDEWLLAWQTRLQMQAHSQANAGGIAPVRAALMSIEGRGAQRYWAGVKLLVPAELGWEGRRHRNARDPFNSALNYGYGVLRGTVEQAIVLAGLDPYAGFVHADRPGKPSLVFDLIEEFRQPVVDRTLLGLVGRRVALAVRADGLLEDDTRRMLAEAVVARLEESAEPYEGKRHALREIIQMQARHLATFLRGERPDYTGFVAKW